ncbi:MAG TPA: hypothetical protein VF278_18865, partial [Pirellulales bacterium]
YPRSCRQSQTRNARRRDDGVTGIGDGPGSPFSTNAADSTRQEPSSSRELLIQSETSAPEKRRNDNNRSLLAIGIDYFPQARL